MNNNNMIPGQLTIDDWLSTISTKPKEFVVDLHDKKCAACNEWHFNTAAPSTCPHTDCIQNEYKDFVSMLDAHKKVRRWHRCCKGLPEVSGEYEIMDVRGIRGKAWFEASLQGFNHVTGYEIEAWRGKE